MNGQIVEEKEAFEKAKQAETDAQAALQEKYAQADIDGKAKIEQLDKDILVQQNAAANDVEKKAEILADMEIRKADHEKLMVLKEGEIQVIKNKIPDLQKNLAELTVELESKQDLIDEAIAKIEAAKTEYNATIATKDEEIANLNTLYNNNAATFGTKLADLQLQYDAAMKDLKTEESYETELSGDLGAKVKELEDSRKSHVTTINLLKEEILKLEVTMTTENETIAAKTTEYNDLLKK